MANQNRRPDLLLLKYQAMRQRAFRFFRVSSYLFYQAWPADTLALNHPVSRVYADLHLENIGSYRSSNGLVYFNINDFGKALRVSTTKVRLRPHGRPRIDEFVSIVAPKLADYSRTTVAELA